MKIEFAHEALTLTAESVHYPEVDGVPSVQWKITGGVPGVEFHDFYTPRTLEAAKFGQYVVDNALLVPKQ